MEPKSYSQEVVEAAVLLVRSKNLTLNEASRSFGIPLSTLGDKVRGRRPIKPRAKFLLTHIEERKLVEWIQLHERQSLRCTSNDMREKVREILELRGGSGRREDGMPGKDWLLAFKKRHPELSVKTPQTLGEERALVTEEDVRVWFTKLKEYVDGQDPTLLSCPNRIFNADETGFASSPGFNKVLTPTETKHLSNDHPMNNTKLQLTLLACSSAAGEFVQPVVIFPGKRLPATDPLQDFPGAFLQISPNGCMNSNIFKTFMADIFIPLVKDRAKPILLLVNDHTSYNSDLSTLDLCAKNGIILYGLLAQASHIVQPLDLAVFGSMKTAWPKVVKKHLETTGEMATLANFSGLLKTLWDKCSKSKTSIKGFVESGIFPFNPEKALSSGKSEANRSSYTTPPPAHPSSSTSTVCAEANNSASASVSSPLAAAPYTALTTAPVPPDIDKLDSVQALLLKSHVLGLGRSLHYLSAYKDGAECADPEYNDFSKTIAEVLRVPHQAQCTLEQIVAPPPLPRNKTGKVQGKNTSLTTVFSSEQFRGSLQQKEVGVKEAEESKKRKKKKLEREEMKQKRRRMMRKTKGQQEHVIVKAETEGTEEAGKEECTGEQEV